MLPQQRNLKSKRADDEEANTPLLNARSIPPVVGDASESPPNKPTASRSFPQRSVRYNTFVEPPQQPIKAPVRSNKPKLPMRTTKISQKLKLFPEEQWPDQPEEEEEADVYTQIAKIPHGMARQEAEMLNKMDRSELSRMTAYCTAS